jgi:hypothetical protein
LKDNDNHSDNKNSAATTNNGTATNNENNNSAATTNNDNTVIDDTASSNENSNMSTPPAYDDITSGFKGITMASYTSPRQTHRVKSGTTFLSPTRSGTPFLPPTRSATTSISNSIILRATLNAMDSGVGDSLPNGTINNPYIVPINLDFPERSHEFCVERISSVKHEGRIYQCIHIRRDVPLLDYNKWDAIIPIIGENDHSRFVLVSGPSQSFWNRDTLRYHGATAKCEATKLSHNTTQVAIEADIMRQRSYWLLVFSESVTLDNSIFSSSDSVITPSFTKQTVAQNDILNGTGITMVGIVVEWRVGEAGGRTYDSGPAKPTLNELMSRP